MQALAGKTNAKANGKADFIDNEQAHRLRIISDKGFRYIIERGKGGAAENVVGRIVRGGRHAFEVDHRYDADSGKGEHSLLTAENKFFVFIPVHPQEAAELLFSHNLRNGVLMHK